MNHLVCSLGALLLFLSTSVAAPAPFPKPPKAPLTLAQLEQRLRERGVRLSDITPVDAGTWVVTFPEFRGGCLVGAPARGTLRLSARDRLGAVNAFLRWYQEQDERRLRALRAARVIP